MAGPEFFQTRMGVKFYEGDVPRIGKALTRIADALEGLQQKGDSQQKTTAKKRPGSGKGTDVRNEGVCAGMKRGAELVRAFSDQIVPGVSALQQEKVLAHVADFVEAHSETYGEKK